MVLFAVKVNDRTGLCRIDDLHFQIMFLGQFPKDLGGFFHSLMLDEADVCGHKRFLGKHVQAIRTFCRGEGDGCRDQGITHRARFGEHFGEQR